MENVGAGAYPDSSFVVSLVCKDANSAEASQFMAGLAQPLLFTSLHRVETRNALRNAAVRGEIAESDRRAAFRQIDADLRNGYLIYIAVDWTDVFHRADELSEKHSDTDGQRTIDLLHVALAVEYAAETFLSFDKRQRGLAKAVGLKVRP
jgi:predicted nucleic acid-binding protein